MKSAFEMLTDDPEQVKNYTMRSDLMDELSDLITANGWSIKTAAERMRVTRGCISDLKCGRISTLSLELLTEMKKAVNE